MTSRHSRMSSDTDRDTFALAPGNLARATPIMPQLGMPPMTREAKESKEQAQAWDASLNRIFQTMQGDDTARYLAYFKARLDAEEAYTRSLEKLVLSTKGSKNSSSSSGGNSNSNNNSGNNSSNGPGGATQGSGSASNPTDPEEIPTTLQLAFDALVETTLQSIRRRRPFLKRLKTLTGALGSLKETHEKQRKTQKEIAKPVFQLYAETRLSTVPKLKRAYEQRCRDVEQALAIEDSDHLPMREKLKNLASSTGAAGRLARSKRDMEDADSDYKTAVQSLETFRVQRERCFDSSFQVMQSMIKERATKCRQCLEAYVVGERDLIAGAKDDMDRFSVAVDCIKPVGDMDQLSVSFTKDINSHPRSVHYENFYNKVIPDSVFGTSLSEYVRKCQHPIPLVIVKCTEAIDRAGLRREGIYRVSGRHAQIMNLKRLFEVNEDAVDLTDPAFSEDCAAIAAVLKIYLRELPEPLFPFPLSERVAYSAIHDIGFRLGELKGRLKRLPDCNIDALQFLIQHLRRIYDHVEDNKMTLENLSMIFTPAIFHDFNSAMVGGPQAPQHQAAEHSTKALSFVSQTVPSSPATSPGVHTAPWTGYPLPPTEQHHYAQPKPQQHLAQNPVLALNNQSSGSASPMGVPDSVGTVDLSPHSSSSNPYIASAPSSSSPSLSGSSTSPTVSSFVPPTNTVSAAASWSNDHVLSDLILNSNTIFNVLPKLPSRTNSMLAVDERLLATSMTNTSLRAESLPSGGNYSPLSRPYSNSRKSSSSSLGTPPSPIENGGGGTLRPRMDSLGPSYTNRPPLRDVDQQYQHQQQQQKYQSQQYYQQYQHPPQQQQPHRQDAVNNSDLL
ncbi:hypothetical protein BG011_001901 [Mortierella polycephala]|uniref:Rho-GAP domain-containing protein n=1 Tax=Mortierella polycephala TaxID=41804 RepID=A0A9P6Q773_9FUNG|nr:hypothetical protein BG011_001901 [Mortierella polycephala]